MAQKLFKNVLLSMTKGADEAITAYRFVKENATNTENIDMADTAGEAVLGAVDSSWDDGDEACKVIIAGVALVQAGATVAAGANVQTDASGKAITAASGDVVVGRALTGGDSGELLSVLLQSSGYTVA